MFPIPATGAEVVGADELIKRIQQGGSGAIDFDKAVATVSYQSAGVALKCNCPINEAPKFPSNAGNATL